MVENARRKARAVASAPGRTGDRLRHRRRPRRRGARQARRRGRGARLPRPHVGPPAHGDERPGRPLTAARSAAAWNSTDGHLQAALARPRRSATSPSASGAGAPAATRSRPSARPWSSGSRAASPTSSACPSGCSSSWRRRCSRGAGRSAGAGAGRGPVRRGGVSPFTSTCRRRWRSGRAPGGAAPTSVAKRSGGHPTPPNGGGPLAPRPRQAEPRSGIPAFPSLAGSRNRLGPSSSDMGTTGWEEGPHTAGRGSFVPSGPKEPRIWGTGAFAVGWDARPSQARWPGARPADAWRRSCELGGSGDPLTKAPAAPDPAPARPTSSARVTRPPRQTARPRAALRERPHGAF